MSLGDVAGKDTRTADKARAAGSNISEPEAWMEDAMMFLAQQITGDFVRVMS